MGNRLAAYAEEMPTFVGGSYANSALGPLAQNAQKTDWSMQAMQDALDERLAGQAAGLIGARIPEVVGARIPGVSLRKEEANMATRLVQVFVADSYDSVPLGDRLLYRGELKLTDADDQELFYELDIKSMLENHNTKRVTYPDKRIKDRVQMLEPARIRDLRMVVVTVASF